MPQHSRLARKICWGFATPDAVRFSHAERTLARTAYANFGLGIAMPRICNNESSKDGHRQVLTATADSHPGPV